MAQFEPIIKECRHNLHAAMKKKSTGFDGSQEEDLLWLLRNKYMGNREAFEEVWGFVPEGDTEDIPVPGIEELKADAYRQLKVSITQTKDPQKLATTLKTLEDMKDRDAGRDFEEKVKGVAESIEAIAGQAPPPDITATLLAPVVSDHVKAPRRRKPRPSKEVNGLDENSDSPREGVGGAEAQEAGLEERVPEEREEEGEDEDTPEERKGTQAQAQAGRMDL